VLQIMVVAAGVGVLFATTPLAFQAVKWFGVAYLLYLAYLQWTAPVKDIEIQQEKRDKSALALLLNGFVVNISNPKAIVFLLAVLPQFLDLSKPQWIQYLIMA
ncbi:LysE family transporter, partial [Acinetobacter sp. 11520]|nr:LysE family transporter [Acinetobacter sp. 11520]